MLILALDYRLFRDRISPWAFRRPPKLLKSLRDRQGVIASRDLKGLSAEEGALETYGVKSFGRAVGRCPLARFTDMALNVSARRLHAKRGHARSARHRVQPRACRGDARDTQLLAKH
jgi:hypothetical protein